MRIRILCIGESKAPYLKEGEKDYLSRLGHYAQVGIERLRPIKHCKSKPEGQILQEEAALVLKKIGTSGFVAALDRAGEFLTSIQFSKMISDWQIRSEREVVFVIGGPVGLHDSVLDRANLILSLSAMTLTHDMVRLVLLEQIYRAYTILRGEKYHK